LLFRRDLVVARTTGIRLWNYARVNARSTLLTIAVIDIIAT
jgi:hypothetical protein